MESNNINPTFMLTSVRTPEIAAARGRRAKNTTVRRLSVRRHLKGHYFVRPEGRDVYLGMNLDRAVQRAIALLGSERIRLPSEPKPPKKRCHNESFVPSLQRDFRRWLAEQPTNPNGLRTFDDAAEELFKSIQAEKGGETTLHYRKTLRAFLAVFGDRIVKDILSESEVLF